MYYPSRVKYNNYSPPREMRPRITIHLTYLGLVPRAYVAALVLLPVTTSEGSSFALADAHSRLQLALWVGHRTASRCLRLQGRLLCTECAGALVSR